MEVLKVQAKEWALSENEELLKGVFVVTVFFFLFLGLGGRYRQKRAFTVQDN